VTSPGKRATKFLGEEEKQKKKKKKKKKKKTKGVDGVLLL